MQTPYTKSLAIAIVGFQLVCPVLTTDHSGVVASCETFVSAMVQLVTEVLQIHRLYT